MEPSPPAPRTLVLGVGGAPEVLDAAALAARLVQGGVAVHVLMTDGAARFVGPAAFAALTGRPVRLGAPPPGSLAALAEEADLLLLAPATADLVARLARGLAPDAPTAFALLHRGPTLLAPAMDPAAWASAATQASLARLRERGLRLLGPQEDGRLAPLEDILYAVRAHLAALPLAGGRRALRLLVTAGPTREPLDPVRFLSNRSSGKMGTAIAAVAAAAGHDVTLITGPTALPAPPLVRRIPVLTAAEMAEAVRREFPACDALVMAAAVADYRPRAPAAGKIKKDRGPLALDLEPTEDILESIAAIRRPGQKVMGFAAETGENLAPAARRKLARKRCDWIVANDVSRADIAFGSDYNQVVVFTPEGELPLPRLSKAALAARLLALLAPET